VACFIITFKVIFFSTAIFFYKPNTVALLWRCYKKHFSSHFWNVWPLSSALRFIVGDFGCKIVGIIMNNNFTTTAVHRSRSWANFSECYWIWSIDYSCEHRHIPTLFLWAQTHSNIIPVSTDTFQHYSCEHRHIPTLLSPTLKLHFVSAIFTRIPVCSSATVTTVVTQASHCWIINNLHESTQKYQVLVNSLKIGFTILSNQTTLFINCKILALFHSPYLQE
jgi:hypothetical protein